MSLYSTETQTNTKRNKPRSGLEVISDPESEFCSNIKDETAWSYLFIHRAKVDLVNKKLKEQYHTFIHKSIVYTKENKKIKKDEQPTISGLLFVQGNCQDIQNFLKENFTTLHLVKDCSTGQIATIPNSVMQPFMQMSEISLNRIRFMPHTFDYYAEGNPLIRITSGILTGLEGYRIRISRDKCFVTSIGGMTVAIGGIHKESFENLDEYIKQRRELLKRSGDTSQTTFTPLQTEIDKCFFTPLNQLDVISIVGKLSQWLIRMKADMTVKNFDEAVEIGLFMLEETGSRFRHIHHDKRIGSLEDIRTICVETDKILLTVINSTDVSVDLKEIVETGREAIAIRFPFLPIEI